MKICEWMPIQKSMLCTHACTHIERHTHTHTHTQRHMPKSNKRKGMDFGRSCLLFFFIFSKGMRGGCPSGLPRGAEMNATWMAELAWLGRFFCFFFLGMKYSGKEITWSRECAVDDESRGATWTGPAPARAPQAGKGPEFKRNEMKSNRN